MNTCSYDVVQLYCMQFNFKRAASVDPCECIQDIEENLEDYITALLDNVDEDYKEDLKEELKDL